MNGTNVMVRRCVTAAFLGWAAMSAAGEPQGDEAAIRDVEARRALAWNRHDASAYAALFTRDADVVNVLGWWWRGRSEIEAKLTDAFVWVFRDSTLTIDDVHVRSLDPSTSIVHVRWTLDGAKTPGRYFCRSSCIPTHCTMPITPTAMPSHQ